MLQNRIYRGRIVHKDKHYPGAHAAIVDEALWDEVQRQLAANRIACASGTHAAEPSLLAGLIYDDGGQRMTQSHANKKGTRYRYYVSQALVGGTRRSALRARRVPAGDVERLVQERLTVFLKSQGEIFDAVEPLFDDVNRRQEAVELAADLAARWPDLEPAAKRRIFERLVDRIKLTQETLEIRIAPGRLLEILWAEDNPRTFEPALWDNELTVTFTVPAHLKRVGMETRLRQAAIQERAAFLQLRALDVALDATPADGSRRFRFAMTRGWKCNSDSFRFRQANASTLRSALPFIVFRWFGSRIVFRWFGSRRHQNR